MIEHLPQELRDRFTDMREMDLTVQSMFNKNNNFVPCRYLINKTNILFG